MTDSNLASAPRFFPDPQQLVELSLAGLVRAHPGHLRLDEQHRVVVRREAPAKVALVSGGGSGHEPLHAGFVGRGMLDAAVAGAVFASPSTAQVNAAIAQVDQGEGVALIVKNYTGDVMNFSLAADIARAQGSLVETVLVNDDVASRGSGDRGPGARGTGAALVAEKVMGAAAEAGLDLAQVVAIGRRAVERTRSIGVAFAAGRPELPLELGVGIHGEPGTSRAPFLGADALVETLVETVAGDAPSGELILLVSGLGGTPAIELDALHELTRRHLESRGANVVRALVGDYVTSLNAAGFLVSVTAADSELLAWWDAPVETPALRW